jgi:hypothetical protein
MLEPLRNNGAQLDVLQHIGGSSLRMILAETRWRQAVTPMRAIV